MTQLQALCLHVKHVLRSKVRGVSTCFICSLEFEYNPNLWIGICSALSAALPLMNYDTAACEFSCVSSNHEEVKKGKKKLKERKRNNRQLHKHSRDRNSTEFRRNREPDEPNSGGRTPPNKPESSELVPLWNRFTLRTTAGHVIIMTLV